VVRSGVPAWGVNPNRDEVAGLRCYPSVADLPETPESALLLVNHERVEEAFAEAAAAGVRAFVVPGVGAEAGEAGRSIRERLGVRARELGAAMVGPNCMGVVVPDGSMAWIGRAPETTAPGHVAVLCQSGSIADAFLSLGGRVGFRCIVSSGAESVTDAADYLAFFAEDEGTRAVGLFLETVRRPDAFVEALERCALAGKTIVCLKVGRSEAGAQAALSHTETLEVLGRGGRPLGARIAGISESGGECALLADQADAAGIPFESLPADLAQRLRAEFPNYLAPGNPLDAWAVEEASVVYPRSLELLAESGAFDILIAQADLSQFRDETNDDWCELTLRALAELRARTGVFVAATTVHNADPPRAFQELSQSLALPLLRGPRDAMLALARTARLRPVTAVSGDGELPDLDDLLPAEGALSEHDSATVLERLGIRFAERRLAATVDEAAAGADELGFPVVVKRDGPVHKSRAGGVLLGIRTADEAAEAARRLGTPVLVAKQVEGEQEVLCGMSRDPDYGPVLVVGRGGARVEELGSVTLSVAPLALDGALALVEEAGIDDQSGDVARALVALSRLGRGCPRIASVDVNPLIVTREGAVAVDALVVVRDDC
jgi:acyl-CoA synthetase (NDP forming)